MMVRLDGQVFRMMRLLPVMIMLLLLSAPLAAQEYEAALILQHDSGVVTGSWNSAETEILTATERGLARVWSAETGEPLLTLDHGGNPLTHAYWVNEDAAILSADESGLLLLSARDDGEELRRWRLAGMPAALMPNAEQTALLALTREGAGVILSLSDGARLFEFQAPVEISGGNLSADERQARAWTEDGRIYAWDVLSGEEQSYDLPSRGMLLGVAWSADDSRLLAWYTNGSVNVYKTDGSGVSGRAISGVRHNSFVQRAIWSRDESQVMSWAGDDTVHIWSVAGGRSQQVFRHEDWVIGARWDADEARVLSWSHIYVYLWESETEWRRFRHQNLARGAIWNGDATRVLSWSWDGTARVWEV